jgi:hypothetical protein
MSRLARSKSRFHSLAVFAALVVTLAAGSGCCCSGWTLRGDWSLALGPGADVGCHDGYDSSGGGCGVEGGCGGPCCGGYGGEGASEEEVHYGTGRFFPVPTQNVFRAPGELPVPTRDVLKRPSELPIPAGNPLQPPPDTGLLGPDSDTAPQQEGGAEELAPPAASGESQVRDRWQPYREGLTQGEPLRLRPIPREVEPSEWIFDDPPPQPASAAQRVTRRQRLLDDGWKAR